MTMKVIEVRGRKFAVETRGIRLQRLIEYYERQDDATLDRNAEEYALETECTSEIKESMKED